MSEVIEKLKEGLGDPKRFLAHTFPGFLLFMIIIMGIDGTNKKVLYNIEKNSGYDYILHLNWSPAGNEIVFAMRPSDYFVAQIHTVNVENGEIKKLTSEEAGSARLPQWFPNGDKIIYSSNNGGFNLFSIDRNGKNKSEIISSNRDNFMANKNIYNQ